MNIDLTIRKDMILARPVLIFGLVGLIVCYFLLALWPFHWAPPQRIANGAILATNSSIRFPSAGLVRGNMPPIWESTALEKGEFKLILLLRALSNGTGCIFAYAGWQAVQCNIAVKQAGDTLRISVRSPQTSVLGQFDRSLPGVFEEGKCCKIVISVSQSRSEVCIDGRSMVDQLLKANDSRSWGREFHVTIGNCVGGDQPWLGEILQCVVEVEESRLDCLREDHLIHADYYWKNFKFDSKPHPNWDALANFLCFIPVGFLTTAIVRHRRPYFPTFIFCAGLSATVEICQFWFDRMPSVSDLATNILGGMLGANILYRCSTVPTDDTGTLS